MTYYAILQIKDKAVMYIGTCDNAAARELVPGTINGKGDTDVTAIANARRVAEQN